ncbi:mitochondrial ribosome and complex I assembly factor AltMIEF1 [Anabrus simplex]|uniref:mitochondrial ribosome and complex I assembly factor AltMIEF1 n=1 Tax=Anabrus simplex TaxID=316456 RepID=UPI0035A3B4AE
MSVITSQSVLNLYRNLIRYSKTLKYTDQKYFLKRIRVEFKKNKDITNSEDLKFHYERGNSLLRNQRVV